MEVISLRACKASLIMACFFGKDGLADFLALEESFSSHTPRKVSDPCP